MMCEWNDDVSDWKLMYLMEIVMLTTVMIMMMTIAFNDHDNCRLPPRTQHAPLPKPALVADVLNRWKSLLSSLKKVFKRVSFFNECFQTSGLCLTKVFKYVVFVWKKFSIFFKNIFFPQGCDCDPTAENPDRFCFHKIIFDFMQFMAMAIPWQYHWLYSGNIMGIITCSRWHWSKV